MEVVVGVVGMCVVRITVIDIIEVGVIHEEDVIHTYIHSK